MKPRHWKLHLLLTFTLFLLFPSFSSAQSQNPIHSFSSQEENFPVAIEDGRQIQSPIPKYSGDIFLLNTEAITLDFIPYGKNSFIYYSNRESFPVYVNIRLSLYYNETGKNTQEAIESALKQGKILKGRYWPEDKFEGKGQEISLEAKSATSSNHNATHFNFSCAFLTQKGRKGKYVIEIFNLWEFTLQVEVSMGMHETGPSDWFPVRVNQTFEFDSASSPINRQRTFDILTVASGKWYLSVYTCGSPVYLKIEIGQKSTGIIEIPNGGSYFYNETIEDKSIESREDRFRSVTVTIPEDVDLKGRIEIYSAVINEPELVSYELEEDPIEIHLTYKYVWSIWKSHELIVHFITLKFQDSSRPTDSVKYEIELFDNNQGITCKEGLRPSADGSFEIWDWVPDYQEQKGVVWVDINDIFLWNNYVRIRAFVMRGEGHKIKSFTYPIGHMNFPIFRKTGLITIGVLSFGFMVMVVILSYKGLKKVKAWRSARRVGGNHHAFERVREVAGENENENGGSSS